MSYIGLMFRPKPQQPREQPLLQHKLPKQPSLPTEGEILFAMQEAEKLKAIVELPWGIEGKVGYLLTIQPLPTSEMLWNLYQGEVPNDEPIFRHTTRDRGLIQSLIMQCVPEDVPAAPSPTAANAVVQTGSHNMSAMLPADTSKATLQGRLENMQIATLVQSIQMSNMSGRLQLFNQGETAQVYFTNGNPVHALNSESVGDLALVEIMTWEQGEFRFFPEENTEEKTIKRRIDGMIMEGITLLDQHKFLQKQGLKPDSYLVRKEARISPEEFKSRVSNGAPLDITKQMQMYEQCDGKSRWQDLLTRRPMIKAEWVPLLFNLTSCGLVTISDSSVLGGKAQGLAGTDLDRGMIAGVLRQLTRAETTMYTYAALQFFIEREFSKSISIGMPLSIIVFEARIILGADPPQPLPVQALREIASRIDAMKRPFDIVAHHETFDFAVLLPGAPAKTARMFANKLAENLINIPLVSGQTQRLLLAGGIASAPEDTQEMGRFLAAAREAKSKAKEARVPLKAFSEL